MTDREEALLASRMEGIQLGQAWVLKRLIERRWGDLPAWAGERSRALRELAEHRGIQGRPESG